MTSLLRLRIFAAFAVVAAALSGCAGSATVVDSPSNASELWQRVAQSIRIGRAFDSSALAQRSGNAGAIDAASGELIKALGDTEAGREVALQRAEALVQEAQMLDVTAQQNKQPTPEIANRLYRQALQFAPEFESENPQLLNSLGYFLADRGQSADDFRLAEKLVRRALQRTATLNRTKSANSQTSNAEIKAASEFNEAIIRDSLAWALYRQNRLSQAATEQQRAIAQAQSAVTYFKKQGLAENPIPADLPFHLGEIYRAQGRLSEAQQQYEVALRLEADHAPSRKALQQLKASSGSSA